MSYHPAVHYEIVEYLEDGRSPYARWFNRLNAAVAARIDRYVRRMEQGNFGYSTSVGGGVLELHVGFGPGYRVYYGRDEGKLVILLGGGDKRRQSRDIAEARRRWGEYKRTRKTS
jgi:putative addiction module killer protein